VNPFVQFCSHRKKEVQATDSCSDFRPGESEGSGSGVLG
jgi:hypothetical protein